MKIKVWGARGSIPTPLDPQSIEEKIVQAIHGMPRDVNPNNLHDVRGYVSELPILQRRTAGGNTACVEVQAAGSDIFIIDAGSGIRQLGLELMRGPCGRGQGVVHLFFSHPHWDHIQGFPFFTPAFVPGNRICIYGIHDMETALTDQQRFLNFPVPISFMQAKLEFFQLEVGQSFTVNRVKINTLLNSHAGNAYSYRFEDAHSTFVYASDAEYKDLDLSDESYQRHLDFFSNADAMIFDAQYGLRESWESKVDWGHSSAMIGVDIARRANVKRLLLFHHEPTYSDEQLAAICKTAIAYQDQAPDLPTCEVIVAHEGMTMDLAPSGAVGVQLTSDGTAAVLTPTTIFDERGVEQMTQQLTNLDNRQNGFRNSIIDLSQVERLSTASLKNLVNFSRKREEGPFVLAAPSPKVEQVIRLGGYADYFAIYSSLDAAEKAVKARETLDLPGQTINDRYQIVEAIGYGRFGPVLSVDEIGSAAKAALHILSPTFQDETIDNFASQVPYLMGLTHKHIAGVYEYNQTPEGLLFLAEELLDGPTLTQRLENAEMMVVTTDEALDIAYELVHALEYAHSQGVVHGNLRPQDIFLTETGVRVCGFGLARLAEGRNLLEAPLLYLTILYVAPEQILGQPLDARVDLYAFGIILYQLFTGRHPFIHPEDDSPNQLTDNLRSDVIDDISILKSHLGETPIPPRELNPELSRPLEHFIMKLLAKNPSDRYASAQQVRSILRGLMFSVDEGSQPAIRPLVGRDQHVATLQACWEEAQIGRGQLALISGEPGIGKTSLANQIAAQSRSMVVLTGHCQEEAGGVPYHPFSEALQVYFSSVPPEVFDQEAWPLISNFMKLVPSVRQLIPDLLEPLPLEPKQEQIRFISSLTQFIRLATLRRPWFLVLEDLHWADENSLELLRYLVRHLPKLSLFIVGTYRSTEIGSNLPLQAALRDLKRVVSYRYVALDRLSQADVKNMLANIWHESVPGKLVEKIYQQTEGNPLYVEEVAKGLRDDGLVTVHDGRWSFPEVDIIRLPETMYEAVKGRIHYLNPDTRDVLSQAAVFGQTFRFRDLVALSNLSEWVVLEHLDIALERQLIQEVAGEGVLRFSHAEIQHVIYHDMGVLRRRRLHLRVGETLETKEQAELFSEELAYHFKEAGNKAKAIFYNVQAGDQARLAYANDTAINLYQEALQLLDGVHEQADSVLHIGKISSTITYDSLRLSANQSIAQVLMLTAQWDAAEKASLEAIAVSQSINDQTAEARSQLAMAEMLRRQSRYDEAHPWLVQAEMNFEQLSDEAGIGQVLQTKGNMAVEQGNYSHAKASFEQSLDIRRTLNDKLGVATLLTDLGSVAFYQGEVEVARGLDAESLALRRELGDKAGAAISLMNLSIAMCDMGNFDEAQRQLEEAIDLFREVGDRRNLASSLHNLGFIVNEQEDHKAAKALYHESLMISRELGTKWLIANTLEEMGGIATVQKQPERALQLYGAAQSLRTEMDAPLPPVDQERLESLLAPAHIALGLTCAQKAISTGKKMSLDAAIEFALQ